MDATESKHTVDHESGLMPQVKLSYVFNGKPTVLRLRANKDDMTRLVNTLKWAHSNQVTVTAGYIQN